MLSVCVFMCTCMSVCVCVCALPTKKVKLVTKQIYSHVAPEAAQTVPEIHSFLVKSQNH